MLDTQKVEYLSAKYGTYFLGMFHTLLCSVFVAASKQRRMAFTLGISNETSVDAGIGYELMLTSYRGGCMSTMVWLNTDIHPENRQWDTAMRLIREMNTDFFGISSVEAMDIIASSIADQPKKGKEVYS